MPMDPQAQALLDQMAALGGVPTHQKTPEQARADTLEQAALMMGGDPTPVAHVEDRVIPGPGGELPIRIYTPEGSAPFPAVVYFHGGGWVICNLDTHDGTCRDLTNLSGAKVISVDYRLAPDAKYPAAAEDCYAATEWVAEHAAELGVDGTRLAVAGDSAGGNLAAVVSLMARDRGGPPLAFQLLIYPVTDRNYETASYAEHGGAEMLLPKADMAWFWDHYLSADEDAQQPYAAPLQADDLTGLPSALVITAKYDVLRDEGEAYARRLQESGVPTTLSRYDGVFHGFFGMRLMIDKAAQAQEEAGAALRDALGTSGARSAG